jgi:protein SCO1/2
MGCHGDAAKLTPAAAQHYPVRGVVVSVEPASQSVELRTETIPGFMEAMTMLYRVSDPAAVGELHAGDKIAATLDVGSAESNGDMQLSGVVVIAQARPDYKPAVQYHVPAVGDLVPDLTLLNQSAKKIHLAQFRGKVLLLTFVYTRCPLADFCPRMGRNFAEIDKSLSGDPKLYAATHLLSVSFDPAYDTPKVLRSYGEAVTGRYTQETFAHWDFAAPNPADLPRIEQFFDLGVTPGENATLQHSLSTLVIGKDGKVVAFYPTNDWKVADVLAKVKEALNSGGVAAGFSPQDIVPKRDGL